VREQLKRLFLFSLAFSDANSAVEPNYVLAPCACDQDAMHQNPFRLAANIMLDTCFKAFNARRTRTEEFGDQLRKSKDRGKNY
jgi:hypothetical protein